MRLILRCEMSLERRPKRSQRALEDTLEFTCHRKALNDFKQERIEAIFEEIAVNWT